MEKLFLIPYTSDGGILNRTVPIPRAVARCLYK